MFPTFLKVADTCPACGEALHHHQADDLPAYLVIVIVGHILVPLALIVESNFAPPLWVHWLLWIPAVLILTMALLQPVKGAVVALQWALGLHGFDAAKKQRMATTQA